jgi:hypothetical protein
VDVKNESNDVSARKASTYAFKWNATKYVSARTVCKDVALIIAT